MYTYRSLLCIALCGCLFVWAVASQTAWASCGASSCPVDTSGWQRQQEKGSVQLDYQFEYSEQDQHRIGRRNAAFREITGHHDEEFTVNRIHRLGVSIGLTDRLCLDFRVPIVSRSHGHVHEHEGEDVLGSWDLSGIGDLAVLLRYAFWKGSLPSQPTLAVTLGGEFPTGKHHEKNSEGDEAELGLQPGSNSLDFIVGLSSIQSFEVPMWNGKRGTLPFFWNASAQFNGPGNDNYRLGDTFQFNIGTSYPIVPKWGLLTQFNLLVKDRDGIGNTDEEVEKTGGEFLYFSPGLEYRPNDSWRLYTLVQIPIYQRVNLIQTTSDYNILMGATYRFGIGGKKRS